LNDEVHAPHAGGTDAGSLFTIQTNALSAKVAERKATKARAEIAPVV
jgi:hypothetical protein